MPLVPALHRAQEFGIRQRTVVRPDVGIRGVAEFIAGAGHLHAGLPRDRHIADVLVELEIQAAAAVVQFGRAAAGGADRRTRRCAERAGVRAQPERIRARPVDAVDLLDLPVLAHPVTARCGVVSGRAQRIEQRRYLAFLAGVVAAVGVGGKQIAVQLELLVLPHEARHEIARVAQLVRVAVGQRQCVRGGREPRRPVAGRIALVRIGGGGASTRERRRDVVRVDVATADICRKGQDQFVTGLEIRVEGSDPAVVLAVVAGRRDRRHRIRIRTGRRGHIISARRDLRLLDQVGDAADARRNAQPVVEEHIRIGDRAARQPFAVVTALHPAGVPAVPQSGMGGAAQRHHDAAPLRIERLPGADIDRAGGRVCIHVGGGRLVDADRIHARECALLEAESARARRIRVDARQTHAVQGDAGVFRGQAAQADVAWRVIGHHVEIDARHVLEELARVAVANLAEAVGRQRVGDVHRHALFHDGARIAFAHADDFQRIQCARAGVAGSGRCAAQLDLDAFALAGFKLDRPALLAEAGVAHRHFDRAGGNAGQLEFAALTRIDGARAGAAGDAHDRIAKIPPCRRIQHAA